MDKLSKHEIDCFVSVEESRWEESDISPLTSIGETEIYFAINPKRPDIKEALDSAMRRIKDDNPFYTDDLYRRYLSAQSSSFLSKEEREWTLIIKYSGDLQEIRKIASRVTPLMGGYAVIVIKEDRINTLTEFPQIEYIEKPKKTFL